jgi:Trypsin-co-occurring domain 2
MAESTRQQRVSLAEAIAGLRAELSRARLDSQGQDIRFDVDKVEVELSIDFGLETEAHGGFKLFSFVDLGGKVTDSTKTGHKVKLSLSVHPDGRPSEPFRIAGKGPAPELEEK